MTTDPFRLALRARPFQAFTIRTADGRDFRIDHPEMALLSAGGRTVAIAHPDMDAFSIVDSLLVTTLEVAQAPERSMANQRLDRNIRLIIGRSARDVWIADPAALSRRNQGRESWSQRLR